MVLVTTVVWSPQPVVMTVVVGITLVASDVEVARTFVLLVLVAVHAPHPSVELVVVVADVGETSVVVEVVEEVVTGLAVVEEVVVHDAQELESEPVL